MKRGYVKGARFAVLSAGKLDWTVDLAAVVTSDPAAELGIRSLVFNEVVEGGDHVFFETKAGFKKIELDKKYNIVAIKLTPTMIGTPEPFACQTNKGKGYKVEVDKEDGQPWFHFTVEFTGDGLDFLGFLLKCGSTRGDLEISIDDGDDEDQSAALPFETRTVQ